MPITTATSRSKCRLTAWQGMMGYVGTKLSLIGTRCCIHSVDRRQKPATAGPSRSLSRVGMEWRARLPSEWALVKRPLGTVLAPVRGKDRNDSEMTCLSQGIPGRKLHPRAMESLQNVCLELDSNFKVQSKANRTKKPLPSFWVGVTCSLCYHATELLVGLYRTPNSPFCAVVSYLLPISP